MRSLNLISPTIPFTSILWFCTVGNFQERLCHIKADLTAFLRTTDKTCAILQGWGWGQGLWRSSRDGPKGSGSTEGPGAWFWVVSLWSYLTWSSSPPSAFHPLFCRVLGTVKPGSSPESACWVGVRQAGRDTRRARPSEAGPNSASSLRGMGGGGLLVSSFCDDRGVNLPTERMVPSQVWLNLTPKVTPILKWLKRKKKKNLRHTVFWFLTWVMTCLSLQSNFNGKDRLEMDVYSSAGNRGNLEGLLLK